MPTDALIGGGASVSVVAGKDIGCAHTSYHWVAAVIGAELTIVTIEGDTHGALAVLTGLIAVADVIV